MRYAVVNGEKREASPRQKGECPCCGSEMVAKCGDKMIHHWAHKSKTECDRWWENETEWHRNWKDEFPKEYQEVVRFAEDGEKHIADIQLPNGFVIEFQNSRIDKEEVNERNHFYKNLIWIVNGLSRRQGDYSDFCSVIKKSDTISFAPPTYLVKLEDCKLLKEWSGHNVPIFFDFSEEDLELGKELWGLFPQHEVGYGLITRLSFPMVKEIINLDVQTLSGLVKSINFDIETHTKRYKKSKGFQEKNRYKRAIPSALFRSIRQS